MQRDIRQFNLFATLPDDLAGWLAQRVEWRTYRKGEYLFREGEKKAALHLVIEGSVKVVREFPNGKNAIMGIFSAGGMVAEIAAVDEKPYPASAIAHTNLTIGRIESADFLELLRRSPDSAIRLICALGGKLRELTGNLGAMAVQPVVKRLARFLVKMADDHEPTEKPLTLTMPITRRDMAELLGAAFEVVERALKKMKDQEIITVDGKRITILKPDELRKMAKE